MQHVVDYMDRRTSRKVQMICRFPEEDVIVRINASLFEWVIENLCKNAVDAMEGAGTITLSILKEGARAVVDAMRRQCDPSLPDEWAFLLCELVRELEPVRLRGGNPAAMAMLQARLDAFVLELRGQLMQALEGASDSMRRYAGIEVKEDRRETA